MCCGKHQRRFFFLSFFYVWVTPHCTVLSWRCHERRHVFLNTET